MFMSKRGEESGNYYKFERSIKIWAIWFNWMISGLMMIKRKGFFTCEPEPSTLLDWLCAFALFIVLLFCNLFCLLFLLAHKNFQLIKNIVTTTAQAAIHVHYISWNILPRPSHFSSVVLQHLFILHRKTWVLFWLRWREEESLFFLLYHIRPLSSSFTKK